MQHWIFQANPDHFDVDQYIERQDNILWLVNQSHFRDQINPGDRVYIWRAQGKRFMNKVYGVIAEGTISGPPEVLPDDCPDLWRRPDDREETLQLRVRISITRRCVRDSQVIQAQALAQDPVTSGLKIQKMPRQTNYLITESESKHISRLIANVALIKSSLSYNPVLETKAVIGGQGFSSSSTNRKAIELAAMNHATRRYSYEGGHIDDVSANHPYD